jgi:hypothetical protein
LTGFPWIQLVFCLACLSMAAWTWMRYSYVWDLSASYIHDRTELIYNGEWPAGACVRVEAEWSDRGAWRALVLAGSGSADVPVDATGTADIHGIATARWGRVGVDYIQDPGGLPIGYEHARHVLTPEGYGRFVWPCVTVGAGRFTGESVAGLVVGAMGVFIFGLYLRRWLVERKALASEPQRDMIA